jgi:hypothetical protein
MRRHFGEPLIRTRARGAHVRTRVDGLLHRGGHGRDGGPPAGPGEPAHAPPVRLCLLPTRRSRPDDPRSRRASEAAAQGRLLGDILGRPPSLTSPDPRWLTSTVVSLARGIYEEKAFDRPPILADALEDAGCDQADIVAHCRGAGRHERGCWVVDLILTKR